MAKDKPAATGTDDEPSAVIEAEPGKLDGALESLGAAVTANDQAENGTADAEGQHAGALQAIDNIIDSMALNPGELVFDIRDELLDIIKHRPKPWSATSQIEQREVASRVEQFAEKLVRQIVEIVAARGQDPIRVLLTKVNAGGEDVVLTGKVKFIDEEPSERDSAMLALLHGIGKFVMLTRATTEDFKGEGREAETQPDNMEFGFAGEEGGDVVDEE